MSRIGQTEFELIASAIKATGEQPCTADPKAQSDVLWCVANELADLLATTNTKRPFDRARFLAACGVS